eukprot:jgi/Galph1/5849/GphlegSOOS_G4478.1
MILSTEQTSQEGSVMNTTRATGNRWSWFYPQRFRQLIATYGLTFIMVSAFVSLVSLIFSYLLISTGVDVEYYIHQLGNWLEKTPLGRPSFFDKLTPELGTLAVAYLFHRLTSPLRFPLCVALTTYIGNKRARRREQRQRPLDINPA